MVREKKPETGVVRIFKTDIPLLEKLGAEFGVFGLPEIIHLFVRSYYEIRSGGSISKIIEGAIKDE